MLKDLIKKTRSYRRFYGDVSISDDELKDMIDHARLSASARNGQVLKYYICNDAAMNTEIFSTLSWAGYLKDWSGPGEGERPSAYIIQLLDTSLATNYFCDDGIAAQSIMLSAAEKGFGGCIIASVKKEKLGEILGLDKKYQILHVFALGKPKEEVVIEEVKDGDIRYWRDENGVHHVPKRGLEEMVIGRRGGEKE